MDNESWMRGYLTGVALHCHVRSPQMRPVPIASMSVTGVAADLEWFADLSGAAITKLSADYEGDVSASWSFDGVTYTEPIPMAELLGMNHAALSAPSLWFRFHCADDAANLTGLILWGFSGRAGDGV